MFDGKSLVPILLLVLGIITFFITLRHKITSSSYSSKKGINDFIEREQRASQVKRGSLPETLFIRIPKEAIPSCVDPECIRVYDKLMTFIKLPLVKLKGKSNTQLKEEYGINHLEELITFEKNYDTFMDILIKYGTILFEKNYIQEARKVLELAISYECDYSRAYITLGRLYKLEQDQEALQQLISLVQMHFKDSPYLKKVMRELESLQVN